MTRVDQFESVFRAAAKEVFEYQEIALARALTITDLDAAAAREIGERVRRFLGALDERLRTEWRDVAGEEFRSAADLVALVDREKPDLICTYRHLHSDGWQWPYSLGEYLDLLTQFTAVPILVLPHPESGRELDHALEDTNRVMVITDHLTGDHRLVNHAVRFTQPEGTLFLTHVEDEATFERFMTTISKIPSLDTEVARVELPKQLLKEPRDYVRSCADVLGANGVPIRVEEVITMGHRLSQYRSLIEEHEIDLLVMNTKDDDQLAIHGLAYPLAVELRQIPLLML